MAPNGQPCGTRRARYDRAGDGAGFADSWRPPGRGIPDHQSWRLTVAEQQVAVPPACDCLVRESLPLVQDSVLACDSQASCRRWLVLSATESATRSARL